MSSDEPGRLAAGSRGFPRGFRELAARLRPFIEKRVAAPADVDDVLQDVFLRLQRSVGSLRDEERFGPWIYRITRSAVADHQRARRRHPLPGGDPPEVCDLGRDHEDDDAVARELATHVAPFVAALPGPHREAVMLTELEGLSQREAARMLGISVAAMKSRVQRGRARLRELLEACCKIALDARGHVVSCEPHSLESVPAWCCPGSRTCR